MKLRNKVAIALNVTITLLGVLVVCAALRQYVVTHADPMEAADGPSQAPKAGDHAGTAGTDRQPAGAENIDPAELKRLIAAGREVVVVDIRNREEFAQGHIPSAVNLPYDEIHSRALDELPQDKLIVVSSVECGDDAVSRNVRKDLNYLGFRRTTVLTQGISGWRSAGFGTETTTYAGLPMKRL